MNNQNKLIYPLSFEEIHILNPDALILSYDELNKYSDIGQIFKRTNKLIILYLLQSRFMGHYTTLFINDTGFHYFDSYGEPMDYFLDILTKKQRIEYNEKDDKLRELLKSYNVNYNQYLLQGKGTDTCGMFVTHRLHNFLMPEIDYIKTYFVGKKKTPDEIVANYCLNLLNK